MGEDYVVSVCVLGGGGVISVVRVGVCEDYVVMGEDYVVRGWGEDYVVRGEDYVVRGVLGD